MTDFKSHCRYRLNYGFPLTVDEQRELYRLAFGEKIPVRKRCTFCEGEYFVSVISGIITCPRCGGSGYVDNEVAQPPVAT